MATVELRGHTRTIAGAIERPDPGPLALVEDFMRVEIGTVDALPPGGFVMLARQSLANVTTWRQAGRISGQVQAEHCPATGLDYPNDWQSAPGTVAGERT